MLTAADLPDAGDRLRPAGHQPTLMPCRFPPRVWVFQLPAIVTRANRAVSRFRITQTKLAAMNRFGRCPASQRTPGSERPPASEMSATVSVILTAADLVVAELSETSNTGRGNGASP